MYFRQKCTTIFRRPFMLCEYVYERDLIFEKSLNFRQNNRSKFMKYAFYLLYFIPVHSINYQITFCLILCDFLKWICWAQLV